MPRMTIKAIKGRAIADAKAIMADPEKLAQVERWFFNRPVSGTVADFYERRYGFADILEPGPLDPPGTIAEAIERFQFPLNPCPKFDGQDWLDELASEGPSRGVDPRKAYTYWNQFISELSRALFKAHIELLPGESVG